MVEQKRVAVKRRELLEIDVSDGCSFDSGTRNEIFGNRWLSRRWWSVKWNIDGMTFTATQPIIHKKVSMNDPRRERGERRRER